MHRCADKVCWIDAEMTNIDEATGKVIEIAAIMTTWQLEEIETFHRVIHYEQDFLYETLSPWSQQHHTRGNPSLLKLVEISPHSKVEVERDFKLWLDKHRGTKKLMMAGSSVHWDRKFILNQFPTLRAVFHFRIIDVTTILELVRRWMPSQILRDAPKRSMSHRALDDIRSSIDLLRYFKECMFTPRIIGASFPLTHDVPISHFFLRR